MATNVSVLTALIEARRLINNGWARTSFARNANGHMCDWGSKEAEQFCSVGAIYRATDWGNTCNSSVCLEVFKALDQHMMPDGRSYPSGHVHVVLSYNDARGRTKEEVLEAFDKTIAAQMKAAPVVVEETKEIELA